MRREQLSAETCGPLPGRTRRPWLTVYAVPGAEPGIRRTHLRAGHQVYALLRPDRLPDRGAAVPDAVRAFAGHRYADSVRPRTGVRPPVPDRRTVRGRS
ncbi:hypothetical protein PUR61_10500 [Streptomyces sp. BE20]|uniref:hypothetical protein n=1 Tax=unclassified Streptomyces TaxID=2593676 RepID=UPI002E775FC2|nr:MULTISPECIES: hypothetical protein [unclassified Streptomyces]MED7951474.1 hypothetical protein [Streptomyces sp. BE303]MEE1822617.1 hypothetical protein [Streptomyces sp. BE20]